MDRWVIDGSRISRVDLWASHHAVKRGHGLESIVAGIKASLGTVGSKKTVPIGLGTRNFVSGQPSDLFLED